MDVPVNMTLFSYPIIPEILPFFAPTRKVNTVAYRIIPTRGLAVIIEPIYSRLCIVRLLLVLAIISC
jgi:hypothetical protein